MHAYRLSCFPCPEMAYQADALTVIDQLSLHYLLLTELTKLWEQARLVFNKPKHNKSEIDNIKREIDHMSELATAMLLPLNLVLSPSKGRATTQPYPANNEPSAYIVPANNNSALLPDPANEDALDYNNPAGIALTADSEPLVTDD